MDIFIDVHFFYINTKTESIRLAKIFKYVSKNKVKAI